MVWPIYLAIVIRSYRDIGAISSIAAVLAIIVVWIAGKLGDKGGDHAVLRLGAIVTSIIHVLRYLVHTPITITLVSAAYKTSFSYLENGWVSLYYGQVKKMPNRIQYIMSLEIGADLAVALLWGGMLVLALVGNLSLFFGIAFAFAAVSVLGTTLMARSSRNRKLATA